MRFFFPLCALFFALVLPPHARANGPIHPALSEAVKDLDAARGPTVYTALRSIWSTWDRADPTQVEAALAAAAEDARVPAPAKAYAGVLTAYARVRRGDLTSARKKVQALGFVTSWLVVGPFDNEGKNGLQTELPPETELDQAIAPGRAYSGKERPVRWRAVPDAFKYGYLDFGSLLRPDRKICGYATTFVKAKAGSRAPRTISAWVGVGGAYKLFWNGRQALEDKAYRGHDADRSVASLNLEPGYNRLTIKACGDETSPILTIRLGDASGAPDPNLEITNDIGRSAEAAKLAPKDKKKQTPLPEGRLKGPLQAFEAAVKGGGAPRDLEAFARYLDLTAGDDAAEHRARDLARRAAEREPSVKRLLLAGELSEDRNTRTEWVEKAADLAKKNGKSEDADILLARAELAGSGLGWRTASRYYDRVLALEPDNIEALRGRVDVYNSAGLRRTALSTLQRALERNPHSVLLLNLVATQLRALGRATEAAEVESLYAAFRFDDRTFLSGQIDLALARRNRPAAERWVERLLESDPDSQWALGVAARAYRSLGQPGRAIATHQRALDLAPEDVGTLRALADLQGELGRRDEQLKLLSMILKIRPQDKEVREYVEHIGPSKPRPDEAYAWKSAQFLKARHAPAAGQTRRTLRDLTVTTVFQNGLKSTFHQVVFQPLTDAGAAAARQYAFQYQADSEVVQLRGARVYRGDGRVDEVTPRNEYADYFGEVVYMQSSEPVQNAEYVLITPKKRTFYIHEKVPNLKRTVTDKGDQRIYRFRADKVAPIVPENAMPQWPEVLGFVHVSTFKSWKDLGRWYWGFVKEQFDLDDETRKLAREVAKDKKTDLEKVKAVYGWVVKNTRYVALELGIYGYKPRRCVQTVTRGWGDCKDKATVIVSLLKELGIPSTIVILRTQLRGDFDSKVASLAPFDHAIVYVPSLDLYLDGTAEYTGSGELPEMDSGALGLLVNQGDAQLVHLPELDPKRNVSTRNISAAVLQNGDAKVDLDFETKGARAADWRRRYHAEATRRDRINSDIGREFPGFELLAGPAGITTNDLENLELPTRVKVHGTARGFARKEGDSLSMVATPGTRLTSSYASTSQRTQDVRILGFSTIDDTFVIKLPPGMKMKSGPLAASGTSPFGSYKVELSDQGGVVTVKSRVEITATRVKPAQYPAFKAFCEAVDRALGGRLVAGQ